LTAVGHVQAAGLLMDPFLVVFLGISMVTVPEAARILRRSPRHLRLYCRAAGDELAVLAVAWEPRCWSSCRKGWQLAAG
jgi:hypothetical protein